MAQKKKSINITLGGVTLTQLALFAKQMAVMMNAGISIIDALTISQQSATGKLSNVLQDVIVSVESGRSLAGTLADHGKVFSPLFISTVQIGEASGTLPETLQNISEQLDKQRALTSKVKGVMMYPAILLVLTLSVAVFISVYILPKLIPLFKSLRVELPFTTRSILFIANLVQTKGVLLGIGLLLLLVLLFLFFRLKFFHPITHWLTINVPILKGFVRSYTLSLYCQTMSVLLRSGVSIDEVLEITKNSVSNYYYSKALEDIKQNIIKGNTLADSLERHSSLFPKLLTKMIKVGEESGQLYETYAYLGDYYEQEVEAFTRALPTILEPVLLMGMGLMVAYLALGILTPLFSVSGSIKR